jgi:hypothetical protein
VSAGAVVAAGAGVSAGGWVAAGGGVGCSTVPVVGVAAGVSAVWQAARSMAAIVKTIIAIYGNLVLVMFSPPK